LQTSELFVDPSVLTVTLSELKPRPIASLDEIRQVVEWSDKLSDENYLGHEHEQVASLFPEIRFYDLTRLRDTEIWNTFF
jgi:hypothetical protein